jgi:predicted transcriptional regulator
MSHPERFYDLLFEVSNEYRHGILLLLAGEPMRVKDISERMDLTSQEISRHVARLGEVGLTYKDVEGFHHLSHLGELFLRQLDELAFTSKHADYLAAHSLRNLPTESVKRLGELTGSAQVARLMEFLRCIEGVIDGAEKQVSLLVDQYPISALPLINGALDRGVEFRIIEPEGSPPPPVLRKEGDRETPAIDRARSTPLVEQRILESVDVILFISERRCLLAFPTLEGEFDYKGFTSEGDGAIEWCRSLFEHYWGEASPKVYISPTDYLTPARNPVPMGERGGIEVEGRDDPRVDAQAVQDAVDNYDEVILKGTFNFGASSITISRSVVIRGDGRNGDVPHTKIYKQDWTFPSSLWDQVFLVEGEESDVTIENIHFTEFDRYCINGNGGRKITIRENKITLETGLYRGIHNLAYGDAVIGVIVHDGFPGGVVIEGNYMDFALDHLYGGHVMTWAFEDPYYRPNPKVHEYYNGFGVYVRDVYGDVRVVGNTVQNMSARAINASVSTESASVVIRDNTISSQIFGSYFMDRRWAGAGIVVHPSWHQITPGFKVEIANNNIRYDKPRFCGILLLGPNLSPEGSGKLFGGSVIGNRIHLEEGSVGILAESFETFDISENHFSGRAYYGVGVFPRTISSMPDLGASGNNLVGNDLAGVEIMEPDEYSGNLFGERTYAGTRGGSETSHLFLNVNTKENNAIVAPGETVIDEGKDNTVTMGRSKK